MPGLVDVFHQVIYVFHVVNIPIADRDVDVENSHQHEGLVCGGVFVSVHCLLDVTSDVAVRELDVEVYKVRCLDDGRWYAVKVGNRQFRGQRDRRRQLQEVAKHELLPRHPHCVRFIKAWEEDNRLYIQTELCECSLAAYVEKHHNLPEQLIWEFLIDMLLGIKHLHDHELTHLDIKPENIFISRDGYYKLGDFGLVHDLKQDDSSDPRDGDPRYLAPELMEGNFTKAADIFSLGITVLELACDLELPSGGENWHSLRSGILPHQVAQSISPQLRCVIQQMMHPDHKQRITVHQLLALPRIHTMRRWRGLYVARRRAFAWVLQVLVVTWFWVQALFAAARTWFFSPCFSTLLTPSRPMHVTRIQVPHAGSFSDDETLEGASLNWGLGTPSSPFESSLREDHSPKRWTPKLRPRSLEHRFHSTPMGACSPECSGGVLAHCSPMRFYVSFVRVGLSMLLKSVPFTNITDFRFRSGGPSAHFNLSVNDGAVKNLFPVNEEGSFSGEDSL
ncbi:hypothetical protein HPB50_007119 [Hyalomma asiaticum]|uniref:Uncharacterized protein n=1 Tax=Hyalomma asiaticum TaxID=266040 RepID=A0ACB7TE39_HYAAI|nr:hypothetical protein HPB50_007119 [Hyalomma asiaticum]